MYNLRNNGYWSGQFTGKKKNGEIFKLSSYATTVTDGNSNVIGYQSTCIDITESYYNQQALKESEIRFRELFNNMWSGIAIYTPINDGEDFKIRDINDTSLDLLNIRKEDVVGRPVTEAFPAVKKFGLFEVFKEVYKTGKPKNHPVSFYNGKCVQSWFENFVFKLPSNEIVAIYNDVTARMKKEEEILNGKESLEKLSNKLRKNLKDTVLALSSTVEYRDKYTIGHSKNVADLACAIAEELGLSADKVEAIKMAGMLHDIGKIAIPMEVLKKPEPLEETEYELIKTHPFVGYSLIRHIEFSLPIARIVLEHHERLDGTGYPEGRKSHELLLESKILAIADVVEAMSLERPYRTALGIERALDEITKNAGIKFDNDAVIACVRLFRNKGYKII